MNLTGFEWTALAGAAAIAVTIISFFLKRTMSQAERHEKDINHIKLTYVTKDEVKELKNELREELKQLAGDVSEIKDRVLYKDDFYRTIVDMNRNIEKLQNYLIEKLGGGRGGDQ
jgi:uncharacterized membrane protein YhiD involved in acid resistance